MAPSGENCQPWKIKIDGDALNLYNDPQKDTSLYNYDQKGSMVALGAFIENLDIASKFLGLGVKIDLFPDSQDKNLVAEIVFSERPLVKDPLYEAIFKRTTNRKKYKKVVFSEEQLSELIKSGLEVGGGEVKIITDAEKIKKLSDPISVNERLIFENPFLHNFFYNHIRWSKEEDEKYKDGFYIKTLELKFPQKIALKILKSWKWAERAKKIGMSKQIAKDNAKNYASASALGIIVIPSNSQKDYLLAGRIMQRVWLKVTSMNLSLQPMTGVLFFTQSILNNKAAQFTVSETQLIENAYGLISNEFGEANRTIAMLFRIGDGGEPTARSSRFAISDIMK